MADYKGAHDCNRSVREPTSSAQTKQHGSKSDTAVKHDDLLSQREICALELEGVRELLQKHAEFISALEGQMKSLRQEIVEVDAALLALGLERLGLTGE